MAEAALREAFKRQPSPEVRRRMESLLASPGVVRSPEVRRQLRAVRLLEMIGTVEARRVLDEVAAGAAEAQLTRAAKAAAARLDRR